MVSRIDHVRRLPDFQYATDLFVTLWYFRMGVNERSVVQFLFLCVIASDGLVARTAKRSPCNTRGASSPKVVSRVYFYSCLRKPVKKNPNLVTSWEFVFSHPGHSKIAGVVRLYCHSGFCVTFGFPCISLSGMGKT